MFGQLTIDTFNNAIALLSSQIESLEKQLNQLREDRKILETQQQAKLTLIGAGQSALDQIQNFLSLATVGENSDLLTDFWAQLEVLRENLTVYPQIEEIAPEESNNDGLDNVENSDIIEVNASSISQLIRDEVNGNGRKNGHKIDIGLFNNVSEKARKEFNIVVEMLTVSGFKLSKKTTKTTDLIQWPIENSNAALYLQYGTHEHSWSIGGMTVDSIIENEDLNIWSKDDNAFQEALDQYGVFENECLDYSGLSNATLRQLCRDRGISDKGNKADLVARLS